MFISFLTFSHSKRDQTSHGDSNIQLHETYRLKEEVEDIAGLKHDPLVTPSSKVQES